MFNKIADKVQADLREFGETAQKRFTSWKNKTLLADLDESFVKTKTYTSELKPEVLKKQLELILETRVFFEMLYESYKRGEFRGACLRGLGQEAVGVGLGMATEKQDVVARDHRSFSISLARETPVDFFWLNHLMRKTGPTFGHDANTHFTDLEHNDIGFLISDMAMPVVLTNGAVWYLNKKRELEKGRPLETHERSCGIGIIGDGATSNGMTHAGMNFAKARNLPVLFAILNNQISFRTSPEEQHGGIDLANRALGYEMPVLSVDGDNVFEVFFASKFLLDFCRKTSHPALLHAITFRRCGHNDTEDTRYMKEIFDKEFLEFWQNKKQDPLSKAREICEEFRILQEDDYQKMEQDIRERVSVAYQKAIEAPEPTSNDLRGALIDPECKEVEKLVQLYPAGDKVRKISFRDALEEALKEEFENDPLLMMLGEDIGWPGKGAFGVTKHLAEVRRDRILNSTLDEGVIAGFVAGAGLMGGRTIGEFQFWNFFLSSPSSILTFSATRPFMQGIGIPGVIRGPTGCGYGSNHYHEARPETYLLKSLGVKVVVPSTPQDAKGLLKSAVHDPDIVAVIEEIPSYGARGLVPEGEYFTSFKAVVRREGTDITLVTWGFSMLKIALESAEILASNGIDLEVVDLRILNPWDKELVLTSAKKTGRVIVLHEDSEFIGFGAEIVAAIVGDRAFYELKARIKRVASKNTPIPSHLALEKARLPNSEDVISVAHELMKES